MSEAQYKELMKRAEFLMDKQYVEGVTSKEEDEMDKLLELIDAYESKNEVG